jgi:hypothetical protein
MDFRANGIADNRNDRAQIYYGYSPYYSPSPYYGPVQSAPIQAAPAASATDH